LIGGIRIIETEVAVAKTSGRWLRVTEGVSRCIGS